MKRNHDALVKTEAYKKTIEYMGELGYSREEAKEIIKDYVFSDEYVNLDVFVKEQIPFHKKIIGYMKGKRYDVERPANRKLPYDN